MTDRPQAKSADILLLVQQTLDDFDQIPLDATLRRTVRVANLLGDTVNAVRLSLELKPSGGHPPSNAEMTKRLMSDPETWGEPDSDVEQAIESHISERTNPDTELITPHSVSELEFWRTELRAAYDSDGAPAGYQDLLDLQVKMTGILERVRHHAFTLLCLWERQLTFAVNQDDAIAAVRRRVDALLARKSPQVLDQFNVAFRRLREAADRDTEAGATEELSHALTSCRRILKAVVDVVQPADTTHPESDDGHQLTDEHYKNRLFEFLKGRVDSHSFRAALRKDGDSLFDRFGSIDELSSKGIHASVALDEAEFCALHTYTLAGELLALAEPQP